MTIERIEYEFSVCKVTDFSMVDLEDEYCFIGKTDEERSVVCRTEKAPANATEREDGWRTFRVQGVLEFSFVGILARISALLAEQGISIFAVSTYNTDYVLTKAELFSKALETLAGVGYQII